MRVMPVLPVVAVLLAGFAGAAQAQEAAPLPPFTPPTTSADLAPLPADPGNTANPPLGDLRATSDTASNISSADTRSPIAPLLPMPDVLGDSPQAFLDGARRSIQGGHSGEAQESLERAETRLLSRDVAPSAASEAIDGPVLKQIDVARQALSVGNDTGAITAIDAALRGG